jgi:hypothetical protein
MVAEGNLSQKGDTTIIKQIPWASTPFKTKPYKQST